MGYFWWLLANILLPLLLPFVPLLLLKMAKGRSVDHQKHTSLSAAVKDGQFCLTAIAISLASVYEVLSITGDKPEELAFLAGFQALLGCVALLVYPVALSFPDVVDFSKRGIWVWLKHYTYGGLSLLICFSVGLLSCYIHAGVKELDHCKKVGTEICTPSPIQQNKGSSN